MPKKHGPWSYVVQSDNQVIAAVNSSAYAFAIWKSVVAHVDKNFDPENRPFVSCSRYRLNHEPDDKGSMLQSEDLTVRFMYIWEKLYQKN